MKKFFTVISLQPKVPLYRCRYEAMDNQKLQMEDAISFPILSAIHGYAEAREEIRVIALVTEGKIGEQNFREFEQQLQQICEKYQICCPRGAEKVVLSAAPDVAANVECFQRLIHYTEDEDELFACMTFGTKPLATAILMALHYAYRIKKNSSISCVVYGEIRRPSAREEEWTGHLYDMTALIQLEEIVNVLAEKQIADPAGIMERILKM